MGSCWKDLLFRIGEGGLFREGKIIKIELNHVSSMTSELFYLKEEAKLSTVEYLCSCLFFVNLQVKFVCFYSK